MGPGIKYLQVPGSRYLPGSRFHIGLGSNRESQNVREAFKSIDSMSLPGQLAGIYKCQVAGVYRGQVAGMYNGKVAGLYRGPRYPRTSENLTNPEENHRFPESRRIQ